MNNSHLREGLFLFRRLENKFNRNMEDGSGETGNKKIEAEIADVHEESESGTYQVQIKARNNSEKFKIPFFKILLNDEYSNLKSLELKPGEERQFSMEFGVDSDQEGELEISLTSEDKEENVYDTKRINLDDLGKQPAPGKLEKSSTSTQENSKPELQYPKEKSNKSELENGEASEIPGKEALKKREKSSNSRDIAKRVDKVSESKQKRKRSESQEKQEKRGIFDRLFHRDSVEEIEEESKEEIKEAEVEEQEEKESVEESSRVPEKESKNIDRVTTGIIGLDNKMEGGFVENSVNLITGKTGTGKTAFCSSFLHKGAQKHQPGIYLTTEERKKDLKNDIEAMFGWDMDELEEKGLVKIISLKPMFPSKEIENLNRLVKSYISDLLDNVEDNVEEMDAQRIVIDSVSVIEMFISDEYLSRVALSSLMNNLRELNVTAVLTGTVPETSEGLSGGGIIEYLVDTVVKLEFMPVAEEHKRTLSIRKMRRTDHSVMVMPFDITPEGLKIIEIS